MTGTVPKLWPGATVVILAGGPSLRTQDISALNETSDKFRIITINDSWRLLSSFKLTTSKPFKCGQCHGIDKECQFCRGTGQISSCAMYFCDASWWQREMSSNPRTRDNAYSFHDAIYKGWWFTGSDAFRDHPQVNALRLTGQLGLETDPTGLRHGSNSGYQAIGLAAHMGAKRVILLGYDMKMDGARSNWHDSPRPLANPDVYAQTMLPHFASLVEPLEALGVEVVNCTPGSALDAFPKATLEEALGAS